MKAGKGHTDRPDQHRWLDLPARARVVQERSRRGTEPALPLGIYLRRPAILATGLAFSATPASCTSSSLVSNLPHHVPGPVSAAHGCGERYPWLVGFLGLVSSGFVCDAIFHRRGDALFARKLVLVGSLLIAAACVALAGLVRGVVPVVALMAISVFFMYLTASTYWAIILDTVPEARVGGVSGFVHLIANLAGIVAPAATGFLVEWSGSFSSAFVLTGAIAVFGAVAVAVFVREPEPIGHSDLVRAPV